MKKYNVYPVKDAGDFFYVVFENQTQQPFDFFFFQEDADVCALFLENGGAFDGWTPRFMFNTSTIPFKERGLDEKFSKYTE
jgi:hypothetical protein